jgi:septal ring factor EnvC (AmiA/AmiB activator)
MHFSDISELFALLKQAPEGIALSIIGVVVFIKVLFSSRKDDVDQVSSISKLQTQQLAKLIEQNTELAAELHAVRHELTEAYKKFNEMASRVSELEATLKQRKNPR